MPYSNHTHPLFIFYANNMHQYSYQVTLMWEHTFITHFCNNNLEQRERYALSQVLFIGKCFLYLFVYFFCCTIPNAVLASFSQNPANKSVIIHVVAITTCQGLKCRGREEYEHHYLSSWGPVPLWAIFLSWNSYLTVSDWLTHTSYMGGESWCTIKDL